MNLPLLTFAPIWLPHWPAWRCTISRIFGFSRLHDTHFKEKLVVFWCCKTRQWFLTYYITMEICNDWRINEKRAKTARAALNTALKIKVNLEGFSCSNFFARSNVLFMLSHFSFFTNSYSSRFKYIPSYLQRMTMTVITLTALYCEDSKLSNRFYTGFALLQAMVYGAPNQSIFPLCFCDSVYFLYGEFDFL